MAGYKIMTKNPIHFWLVHRWVSLSHFEFIMLTSPWPKRWDHVLPCGWPENQPVVRAPCDWSCMGRVAFCLKYNYIFLWQKRHDFNRIVFAQGAGSVVGVPHFGFMIFTLPWPERCDCPGAVLSCDWSENQSRRGSLWLVLHGPCRILI